MARVGGRALVTVWKAWGMSGTSSRCSIALTLDERGWKGGG